MRETISRILTANPCSPFSLIPTLLYFLLPSLTFVISFPLLFCSFPSFLPLSLPLPVFPLPFLPWTLSSFLLFLIILYLWGFAGGASGKESVCQCRRCRRCEFDPWVRKIPWRRKWQPTPVFLPGESHGQRSLVGYGLWGGKELDTTERLSICICTSLPTSCSRPPLPHIGAYPAQVV